MKRTILLTTCILLFTAFAFAADDGNKSSQTHHLQLTSTFVSHSPAGAFMTPMRCDSTGDMFARRYDPTNIRSSPVVKFNSKGEELSQFKLQNISGLSDRASIGDFAITQNGDTYLLVYDSEPPSAAVYSFKSDGTFIKKVMTLPDDLRSAKKLAVFGNGNLLITGLVAGTRAQPNSTVPWTVVFSADGRMLKSLSLDKDDDYQQAALRGDAIFTDSKKHGNWSVTQGTAVTGADGNVYLMRRAAPPTVHVISPSGDIVRSFPIGNDSLHLPRALFVAQDKLALLFNGLDDRGGSNAFWLVASTKDGKEIERYQAGESPDLGGAFACFDGKGFTFFGIQNQRLMVKYATPE
jgi:hypothetical protein